MAASHGILIVKQPVLDGIADEDIIPALPEAQQRGARKDIEIDTSAAAKRAIETGDWDGVASELAQAFRDHLRPAMEAHPGWRLAYFGTAPIPLAMQLGFLTGSWATVDTFLRHHARRDWAWMSPPGAEPEVKVNGIPKELVRAEGDAVIRVSTTRPVEPLDTQAVVAGPLAEVDIELVPMGDDAVATNDLLDRVADAFKEALDAILTYRPGVRTVHVFAAVPVGLAFRMGTRVSPTMHPRIQTYYFVRTAARRQIAAIALQDIVAPRSTLSDDERKRAAKDRKKIAKDFQHLQTFAASYGDWAKGHSDANWLSFVLPDEETRASLHHPWGSLPDIAGTPLVTSTMDTSSRSLEEGFRYDEPTRAWQLGDELVTALGCRFADEGDRLRAVRMLLLHEASHTGHRLTRATSIRIGRFPKLLEEIDYQADVWAMLHEYARTRLIERNAVSDAPMFFLHLIQIAVGTFWAFDAGSEPLYDIQVRRLNRYLIWYWQYLRMERARSLVDVVEILAHRPFLELAGPSVLARGDRVYYRLDPAHVENLELGILHENAVHRFGPTFSLPLETLLDGFRTRNGDMVKEALRGAFDQLQK